MTLFNRRRPDYGRRRGRLELEALEDRLLLSGIIYNEANSGDLSNNQAAPTALSLGLGTNSVLGSVGPGDTQDWVTLHVPAGMTLNALVLASYVSSDSQGFIGVQRGTAFVGSAFSASSYLGYTHYGTGATNGSLPPTNLVGTNILPLMGDTSLAAGAQGFVPPLGSGDYTFLIQQLGASTAYQFDFDTVSTAVATKLVITNVNTTSVTAGGTVTVTVTAEDSTNAPVPGYMGTVQLTSTDTKAAYKGGTLPATDSFLASDQGVHTFTVTLNTAATSTITITDQAQSSLTATTSPITVAPGPLSKYVVNLLSGTTVAAGNPVLFTVQAADAAGNPVTSGPSSVSVTALPTDPQSAFLVPVTLNNGFGFSFGSLKTAGSYALTATANTPTGTVTGTSASFTVTPSVANFFTVTASVPPAGAITTGNSFNVAVTAFDHFGNIATGYTGTVKLTSTDPGAATLGNGYTFTSGPGMDNGTHVFSATLVTGGSQKITATDTVSTNPVITGTSAAITTRGLTVALFAATPTGFTAAFSKTFDPTRLTLYGPGLATVQDVTLVGSASGPITGTLLVDPSSASITFKATENSLATFFGAPILPDDTYTVTLVSGSANGFRDALGAGLDGANNGGHANYTTTFKVTNAGKAILSIPDFSRGPDGAHAIQVPNDTGHGVPITLLNAASVTDAVFTLNYNPALLTVTSATSGDATDPASSFVLVGSPTLLDATHATAIFHYSDSAAKSGTVVLGDIVATVPASAGAIYKSKELLGLSNITANGLAFTGVSASGVHVNAYFGDVTGNGGIDGLDVATANTVAKGAATGLGAYQLLDPAIVADVASDISVDAGDVSTLAAFVSHLPTPQVPIVPTGVTVIAVGADPTLSLRDETAGGGAQAEGGARQVSVMLDQPHPDGSTGMTEALLALTHDPTALSVSSSDITLGSIPGSGTDWQLMALVDQATGQIAITLFSTTPISITEAGSLVNIRFHILPGASVLATRVQLVNRVMLDSQEFVTQVDDALGQFVLSPPLRKSI